MNSGKIVAGGRVDGTEIEGSIRGPRGPKKVSRQEISVPQILMKHKDNKRIFSIISIPINTKKCSVVFPFNFQSGSK